MADTDGESTARRKKIERGTAWTTYRLELARQADILLPNGEPPPPRQSEPSCEVVIAGSSRLIGTQEPDPVLTGGWWTSDAGHDTEL